ncbi:hypothetical protein A9Q81_19040 [Gammaproteobacteria bacterium 42_54_T18]|nr:hypothetical protein A9Q81_19040 [Gammaproteobacteria bacterium 42_54_T18]
MFKQMKLKSIILKSVLLWVIAGVYLFASQVQASLMITPTRVVLDERNRTADVTLLNTTTTTNVYRIQWQQKAQTAQGGYIDLETHTDADHIASDMLRHSPRKVTIGPGKYQRIKLRLRLPADLPDGEYRSHLLMKVVDTGVTTDGVVSEGKGAKLMLIPRLSFSIPIMVRKGQNNSTTGIASLELNTQEDKPKLMVDVTHQGDFSSYGILTVYMKANDSSPVEKIGEAHNIALFRETALRKASIPLQIDQVPAGAVVQVVYDGDDEYEGQQLGTAAFTYEP